MVLSFDDFEVLTFDCYGTLITGRQPLTALHPILAQHRMALAMDEALALFGALESEAERGSYRTYRNGAPHGTGGLWDSARLCTDGNRTRAVSRPRSPPGPSPIRLLPYRPCIQNTSSPSSRTLMMTCSPCQRRTYTCSSTGLLPHNKRSPTSPPSTISMAWHVSECLPRKSCMSPRAFTTTSPRPGRSACPLSGSTDATRSQVLAPRPQRRSQIWKSRICGLWQSRLVCCNMRTHSRPPRTSAVRGARFMPCANSPPLWPANETVDRSSPGLDNGEVLPYYWDILTPPSPRGVGGDSTLISPTRGAPEHDSAGSDRT